MDTLKVWIKYSSEPYPSVLTAEHPVIKSTECRSSKVSIELINSQTNEIEDHTEFAYQEAFLESHIDDWSERLKPDF